MKIGNFFDDYYYYYSLYCRLRIFSCRISGKTVKGCQSKTKTEHRKLEHRKVKRRTKPAREKAVEMSDDSRYVGSAVVAKRLLFVHFISFTVHTG